MHHQDYDDLRNWTFRRVLPRSSHCALVARGVMMYFNGGKMLTNLEDYRLRCFMVALTYLSSDRFHPSTLSWFYYLKEANLHG